MARSNDAIRLLPLSLNTHALLAIDGPASATWNTIVEAVSEGGPGSLVTLAATADGTWVPNIGTFTISTNPTNAKAELDLDTPSAALDTIVQAKLRGTGGNSITIAMAADSDPAGGVTIEEVGNVITIHVEDGVSTVLDVETAITAESTLIEVKTAGTAATVLAGADAFAATALAGGTTETVTIGTTVYTFVNAATTTAFDVEIGAASTNTLDNLIAAINLTAGAGTVYGSATTIHPTVRAFAGAGDTMVVHTKSNLTLTAVGTLIATTETCANCAWGAATLADGTDGTNVTFDVSGTAITCHFASGYSTVADFEEALAADVSASALLRVKTAGTTPLYLLVVTDDDFAATALAGGAEASEAGPTYNNASAGKARPFYADEALVLVSSETGSGTMTATVTLWGWSEVTSTWYVLGGLNDGDAIAESSVSNTIAHAEIVVGIGKFSRFAAELAVAGTATEVEVWMDFVRPGAHS
jgi:hypothetical protein